MKKKAGMGNEAMEVKLFILSDIHGNMTALKAVLKDVQQFGPDAVAVLGDVIDYGMRSNEAVAQLEELPLPKVCYLWGNHEYAILKNYFSGFSSARGERCARFTAAGLTEETRQILMQADGRCGWAAFSFGGFRFLAVHGSLQDPFWKAITPQGPFEGYEAYDYVLSGHSHVAQAFPVFYDTGHSEMRGKKRTIFINPGSVGQPRNHDPRAQYILLDTEQGLCFRTVDYDIPAEQMLYRNGEVDVFYRDRLAYGI